MPFTQFVIAARVCSGGRQDYCAMIISMVVYSLERDNSMSFGQLFRVTSKIFICCALLVLFSKSVCFLLYFMSVPDGFT
jgi:hypothetical protein